MFPQNACCKHGAAPQGHCSSIPKHCRRASVCVFAATASQTLREIDELPSEKGLPFIGLAHKMGKELFPPLFRKHGGPYMINMGPLGGWNLAIKEAEDIYDCLSRYDDFEVCVPASTARLAIPQEKNLTNEEARPWRAALFKVMLPDIVLKLQLPLMGPDFQERMRRAAASGDDVMFRQEARTMAFSVASRAALGAVLTDEDMEEMFPLFEEYSLGTLAINYGLRDGLPGTTYHKSIAASKVLKKMVADRIEAALGGTVVQERDSVIRRLLAHLEEEGLDFSRDSDRQVAVALANEAVFMMLVGTDNSAYMMLQAMIFLHKHPEWLAAMNDEQARLQKEHGPEMGRQVVSRSAVATAVAEEALRLKPPAKLVFRRAVRDTTLAGIRVPSGTSIMCHIVQAAQDTGKSGPKFDPTNWLSPDWTEAQHNTARGNLIWGGGIRRCVGVSLATIELITALCCLGREVKKIDMSPEVAETPFLPFLYPSDMPMKLTPLDGAFDSNGTGAGAAIGGE